MPEISTEPGRVSIKVVPNGTPNSDRLGVVETPDINDYSATLPDYRVRMRYEEDKHLYMMANTVPGSTDLPNPFAFSVSFVQLANKTLLWVVDWTAARWLKKPPIPNPDQFPSSNWVLLKRHIEPGMTIPGPDNSSLLYRISGTYWYGHKSPDPDDVIRNMNFAAAPWLDNAEPYVQDRTIDDSMYQDNIINVV